MLGRAALRGALAGLAGTAVMTLAEKVEQRFTSRPNSYVPARAVTAPATGRRLPGSARHAPVRLAADQTLENATGGDRRPTW